MRELIGNPSFKADMAYTPARAYTDDVGHHRVIDEMWTADWWGEKQKVLPKGAMIAPIILASDKTSLSQFQGDKSAWPVYMSIGNIAKAKRRQASARQTRVYPILAAYVTDFPEQCLCLVAADERGDGLDSAMCDPESTKDVLQRCKNGQHPPEFEENGLCAIYKPFWADMPHADIFLVFTPDLLHQVHKGVFKDHLIKWCLQIISEEEMDAHFKAIPDYPGLCCFKKGISTVKQWTGREHKEMQRVFIVHVLVITQSILDFSYYAQLQIHTADSLEALQSALAVFHANKDILKDLAIREHFNIPKLHQLSHYVQSITLFGAADGFNTELPECLHIDFAKDAYCASNKCNYEEQMVFWLQRQDAVFLHNVRRVSKDRTPVHPCQSVQKIVTAHGTTDFLPALQHFLHKNLSNCMLVPGLQDHFDIYCQVVIVVPPDLQSSDAPMRRRIRAMPERLASGQKPSCPAHFDMALTSDGVRVAQVRAILSLPRQFGTYSRAPAYNEWFTPFKQPDPSSQMRQLSHSTHQLHRNAAVIHVDDIVRLCHLIPKMGPSVDLRLRSVNAYEAVNDYYFNEFIDSEIFSACR
ncbi:hypothetical protein BDR07DRAFT_1451090 [Suillus spraguei]|nr:hypothetical protein BDR07DRAFT_1451090 [Suillus spraguei]